MSSWAACVERARLSAGETVLVNGATGVAGGLAVQIARRLGAKKVIATGRNAEALKSVAALGADVTIPLVEDDAALEASFHEQFAKGVDVVLDYLWGRSAERMLVAAARAAEEGKRIRFVQIGVVERRGHHTAERRAAVGRDRTDGQRHRQRHQRPAASRHPLAVRGRRAGGLPCRDESRAIRRGRTGVVGAATAPHGVRD